MQYTVLLERQRKLPFGQKLQNHGLNGRLNDEFKKYNRALDAIPILRDLETKRYWVNEDTTPREDRQRDREHRPSGHRDN